MAAAAAEHKRRAPALNSVSSFSSLVKLILESSSSAGSSARSSSQGWDETLSSLDAVHLHRGGGGGGEESISWSFEGESGLRKKSPTIKRELVDRGDDRGGGGGGSNVGRCVAGCAADCTALCCCPLTLFHVLALLVVKVPSSMAARFSRWKKTRRSPKPKDNNNNSKKRITRESSSLSRFALRRGGSARSDSTAGTPRSPPPHLSPRSSPLPPAPSIKVPSFWRDFESAHYESP